MKKIRLCLVLSAMFSVSQVSFAAQLCAVLNNDSRWTGGVFSVITESGQTIATSNVVAMGGQGCTGSFVAGTYLVRFTGVNGDKPPRLMDGIYGCLTQQSYVFDEASVLTVVFDYGRPPFNGNDFCGPV